MLVSGLRLTHSGVIVNVFATTAMHPPLSTSQASSHDERRFSFGNIRALPAFPAARHSNAPRRHFQ